MLNRRAICLFLTLSMFAAACQLVQHPTATPTLVPTPTAVPPTIDNLPGRGVQITGRGDTITDHITPEYTQGITVGISVVTVTHDGNSDFTLQAIENSQPTVLVAATGRYQGSRPIVIQDDVAFQVKADGNWTIRVEPLRGGGQPSFSGAGDRVSALFDPPPPETWSISGGGRKLSIDLHCISGDGVVVDTTGPYDAAATITFSRGPCFWEVQSDGTWTLKPQLSAAAPTSTLATEPPKTPAPAAAVIH